MIKPLKTAIRKFLKRLINSNALTRTLNNWRQKLITDLHCKRYGVIVTYGKDAVELRNGDRVMLIDNKHAIYSETLAKSFDVYFSAVVPDEKNGIKVVDYSKPKLHTLKNGLQFEFSSFPEEIEAIDSYFLWYKPKAGETVFDLGAHCGFSSYFFSNMVGPSGRVICFEPDPINLAFLRRNIERYNLQNITIVPAAIGNADGTASFSSEGTIGSQLTNSLGRESVGSVITVPVMSLKTAFEKFGVPQFCKIDIECAEVETLDAASDYLPSIKTHFVVDTNHTLGGALTDKRVEAIFRRAGYEAQTLAVPFPTTYARLPA